MRAVRAFGRFLYDVIVGDDYLLSILVVVALMIGVGLLAAGLPDVAISLSTGAVILAGFVAAVLYDVRR